MKETRGVLPSGKSRNLDNSNSPEVEIQIGGDGESTPLIPRLFEDGDLGRLPIISGAFCGGAHESGGVVLPIIKGPGGLRSADGNFASSALSVRLNYVRPLKCQIQDEQGTRYISRK